MKGNKFFTLLLVVAAALLLAAAIMLHRSVGEYRDVSGQLNSARRHLGELFKRNPFPSEQNIAKEQEHLETLRREFAALRNEMAKGQAEPVQTAPVRFIERFRNTTASLTDLAEKLGVKLPEKAAFGFERHLPGDLPGTADVPRLIQQLVIIEQLVEMLYDQGISELVSVRRQEFEAPARDEPSPRRTGERLWGARVEEPDRSEDPLRKDPAKAGLLEDDDDYTSLSFTLEFKAREDNLLNILNALASHSMFIVVTRVEIENPFEWRPARTLRPPPPPANGVATGAEETVLPDPMTLSREERKLTDRVRDTVNVKIDLRVYRFRKDDTS